MNTKLKPGQVNIHGKVYDTVALRVQNMRKEYPDWTLETKLVTDEGDKVIFKASLRDQTGKLIATGYAEETRESDDWTATSAVEICETSAVGRCLGFAHWPGSETEFDPQIASADEVSMAIRKQADKAYGAYMETVWKHWESIVAIKQYLAVEDIEPAMEAWREIGHDDMIKLWKAPTKGGIFTIKERELLKAYE